MIQLRIALVAALALSGCVDPESRLNAFAARLDASRGGGGNGGVDAGDAGVCEIAPGSVAGLHVLALSVSITPGKPILALLDVSTPGDAGATSIQWSGTALSASDRKTPVGSMLQGGPFPVDDTGGFVAPMPGLQVTGAANPISGSDITADVTLTGSLCLRSGGYYCGTAQGQATQPITLDLAGSTFTLIPVPDAQTLPAQPPIDCAGTLADPL